MNNLYRKIAVASVCTALGFALGANKEAEAATFSNYHYSWLAAHLTFQVIDGGSYGSFDGMGDRVTNVSHGNNYEMGHSHSWLGPKRTDTVEVAALLEFPSAFLTRDITGYRNEQNAKITSITNAVLRVFASPVDRHAGYLGFDDKYAVMGVFGYVGNGIAEASDFEAGVFLDSQNIIGRTVSGELDDGGWYDFNVTPLVKEIFSNNNEFAGFALRSLSQHEIVLPASNGFFTAYPPTLIVSGEIERGVQPEPVPEPTTIFGSALALGVGGWLKRKKSSQQNKTTPQH
jgi:hypothetical protein